MSAHYNSRDQMPFLQWKNGISREWEAALVSATRSAVWWPAVAQPGSSALVVARCPSFDLRSRNPTVVQLSERGSASVATRRRTKKSTDRGLSRKRTVFGTTKRFLFAGQLDSIIPADAAEERPLTCVGPTRRTQLSEFPIRVGFIVEWR